MKGMILPLHHLCMWPAGKNSVQSLPSILSPLRYGPAITDTGRKEDEVQDEKRSSLFSSSFPLLTVTLDAFAFPFTTRGTTMEIELIAVMLCAVLPLYPALFVIYQKIGKYDLMCEELGKLREEHDRLITGKEPHGT